MVTRRALETLCLILAAAAVGARGKARPTEPRSETTCTSCHGFPQ